MHSIETLRIFGLFYYAFAALNSPLAWIGDNQEQEMFHPAFCKIRLVREFVSGIRCEQICRAAPWWISYLHSCWSGCD
jgi:hypothetical protein